MTAMKKGAGKPHQWTEWEEAYIRLHYPTEAACDIADRLSLSAPTVSRKAKDMGLVKSRCFSVNSYHGRYINNYKNR